MITSSSVKPSVLLIDDEVSWLRIMSLILRQKLGYENVFCCDDSRDALTTIKREKPTVILLDITMPHVSGEELLGLIQEYDPSIPVIFLTGRNETHIAVNCMRNGAFDFYLKTDEEERLLAGIKRAVAYRSIQLENSMLHENAMGMQVRNPEVFNKIVTKNQKMKDVFRYIEAIAFSREPVLITGETGTGKELVAKAVHDVTHPDSPIVSVNVAGLDDNVFSDTLFGHTKGAFTGALNARPGMVQKAQSGTLFLDEIGDLQLSSQVKLLRLLQNGEYFQLGSDDSKHTNARIVCATNIDLEKRVAEGVFRQDLYYRLYSHRIVLPPLRQRSEDVELLFPYFLEEAANAMGVELPPCTNAALNFLSSRSFNGNIRELRSLAYDLTSIAPSGGITRKLLLERCDFCQSEGTEAGNDSSKVFFSSRLPSLKDIGNILAEEAINRSGGSLKMASEMIGVTRQALSKRLKGID